MPCGVFHLPGGLHQRRGKEPGRGQGEAGAGRGRGAAPRDPPADCPAGRGPEGALASRSPLAWQVGSWAQRPPTSTSPLASARGLGAPAAWEEGITLHPLPTGRSEALRKLWGQRRQPGAAAGDWEQRSRSEPRHRVGRGGLRSNWHTTASLICLVLTTFHC